MADMSMQMLPGDTYGSIRATYTLQEFTKISLPQNSDLRDWSLQSILPLAFYILLRFLQS